MDNFENVFNDKIYGFKYLKKINDIINKGKDIQTDDLKLCECMGLYYLKKEDYKNALKCYAKVLKESPINIYPKLAKYYCKTNRINLAFKYLYLSLKEGHVVSIANLVVIYKKINDKLNFNKYLKIIKKNFYDKNIVENVLNKIENENNENNNEIINKK